MRSQESPAGPAPTQQVVGADAAARAESEARVRGEDDGPEVRAGRALFMANRRGRREGLAAAQEVLEQVRADYERRKAWRAAQPAAARKAAPMQLLQNGGWTSLGPANGAGRMTAVAMVNGTTFYAGAADGGVWKTTDGGANWTPLTDDLSYLSVGAITVISTPPTTTIYVGTGEGQVSSNGVPFPPGYGLLKSTNDGQSWILPQSVVATRFLKISVNPNNGQDLVVATDEGGFRSLDGGQSWTNVIPKATYGWVSDVVRNPADPSILYAATWSIDPAGPSGACLTCKTSRILKSTDFGDSWVEKVNNWPKDDLQILATSHAMRTELAIAPSSPNVVYAAAMISQSGFGTYSHVYRTMNGGDEWTDLTGVYTNPQTAGYMGGQAGYNNAIVVNPSDFGNVIAGGVNYINTFGGANWFKMPAVVPAGTPPLHVDAHAMQWQNGVLVIANDGGIWTSTDGGLNVTPRNDGLVTRQYYSLAQHPSYPDVVLAGAQDNGTDLRESATTQWSSVGGGDGTGNAINQALPAYAFISSQYGTIDRLMDRTGVAKRYDHRSWIAPPLPSTLVEPRAFETALALHDGLPGLVVAGSFRVWLSRYFGDRWEPLPTATTDGSVWSSSSVITSIALAPTERQIILVGKVHQPGWTLDAVFRSENQGQTWKRADSGLPSNVYLNHLEINSRNKDIAYAAFSRGPAGAQLYRTLDGGQTWTSIIQGLPATAVYVVRNSPLQWNVVYCGTDFGIYQSQDNGDNWSFFSNGLPAASVQDIEISPDGSKMRVATFGRGAWERTLTSPTNNPPVIGPLTFNGGGNYLKGTTVTFQVTFSDPDPGDVLHGQWVFGDDSWVSKLASSGVPIDHLFARAGYFPVGVRVRDLSGAVTTKHVEIVIQDLANWCSTPQVIPAAGPYPWEYDLHTFLLSKENPDPIVPCSAPITQSVWFEFTPVSAGDYVLSTCGANVDTAISLWTGPSCGPYQAIAGACNDNATAGSGCYGMGVSSLTVNLPAGQTVRVLVSTMSSGSSLSNAFRLKVEQL